VLGLGFGLETFTAFLWGVCEQTCDCSVPHNLANMVLVMNAEGLLVDPNFWAALRKGSCN
jgi:hypothetical protein